VIEARSEGDEDAIARDPPLLAGLVLAFLRSRVASGDHRGERWRRLGDRVDPAQPEVSDDLDLPACARPLAPPASERNDVEAALVEDFDQSPT
jgi:hypothetical protein